MLVGKNHAIRRRAIVGLLLAASLTLLTLSFRQGSSGVIGAIQRGALSVTAPFSGAGHRVTRPFVDGWHWATGLVDARSENERLTRALAAAGASNVQIAELRQKVARLESLLHYQRSVSYRTVSGAVIAQSPTAYLRHITIDVGSGQGVHVDDPVVAPAGEGGGLVGRVASTTANASDVLLISDPSSSVTARVLNGTAKGLVEPSAGDPGVLQLSDVDKSERLQDGEVVVTAGWRSTKLQALLPPGIPIGNVTSHSGNDFSGFWTIQVTPFVDFGNLSDVLVLEVQRG
jgi:rod shape-determining protein MreC